LAIAIISVVLPLLPTVPFVLLAAMCFARSSDRLHNWLLSHPTFGPFIDDWYRSGAIRLRAKRITTVSIIAVFTLSVIFGVPVIIIMVQGITLIFVLAFIWTRPNG
jgi:uncharacterized membrane protein YbaN (DUF454 family)